MKEEKLWLKEISAMLLAMAKDCPAFKTYLLEKNLILFEQPTESLFRFICSFKAPALTKVPEPNPTQLPMSSVGIVDEVSSFIIEAEVFVRKVIAKKLFKNGTLAKGVEPADRFLLTKFRDLIFTDINPTFMKEGKPFPLNGIDITSKDYFLQLLCRLYVQDPKNLTNRSAMFAEEIRKLYRATKAYYSKPNYSTKGFKNYFLKEDYVDVVDKVEEYFERKVVKSL